MFTTKMTKIMFIIYSSALLLLSCCNAIINNYNGNYNSGTNYNSGNSYNSGTNYNSGTSYNSGNSYNSGYDTSYNPGYNSGYGTNYNSGYGTNYNSGYGTNYGTNYNSGYGTSYGTGFGSNYDNFYQTFPYFFLDPFGIASNGLGFQSSLSGFGFPWSPFGNFPSSFGYPEYYSNGYNSNLYGIHPRFGYQGHYGVYQNYGYGSKYPSYYGNKYSGKGFGQHVILPVPVPVPMAGHQFNPFFQRQPTLGERILNSPLLPAALIAAPLILLAKGK